MLLRRSSERKPPRRYRGGRSWGDSDSDSTSDSASGETLTSPPTSTSTSSSPPTLAHHQRNNATPRTGISRTVQSAAQLQLVRKSSNSFSPRESSSPSTLLQSQQRPSPSLFVAPFSAATRNVSVTAASTQKSDSRLSRHSADSMVNNRTVRKLAPAQEMEARELGDGTSGGEVRRSAKGGKKIAQKDKWVGVPNLSLGAPAAFPSIDPSMVMLEEPAGERYHIKMLVDDRASSNAEKREASYAVVERMYACEGDFPDMSEEEKNWYAELKSMPMDEDAARKIAFASLWPILRQAIIDSILQTCEAFLTYQSAYFPVRILLGLEMDAISAIMHENIAFANSQFIPAELLQYKQSHPDEIVDPDTPPSREIVRAIQYLMQERLPGSLLGEWQFPLPELQTFHELMRELNPSHWSVHGKTGHHGSAAEGSYEEEYTEDEESDMMSSTAPGKKSLVVVLEIDSMRLARLDKWGTGSIQSEGPQTAQNDKKRKRDPPADPALSPYVLSEEDGTPAKKQKKQKSELLPVEDAGVEPLSAMNKQSPITPALSLARGDEIMQDEESVVEMPPPKKKSELLPAKKADTSSMKGINQSPPANPALGPAHGGKAIQNQDTVGGLQPPKKQTSQPFPVKKADMHALKDINKHIQPGGSAPKHRVNQTEENVVEMPPPKTKNPQLLPAKKADIQQPKDLSKHNEPLGSTQGGIFNQHEQNSMQMPPPKMKNSQLLPVKKADFDQMKGTKKRPAPTETQGQAERAMKKQKTMPPGFHPPAKRPAHVSGKVRPSPNPARPPPPIPMSATVVDLTQDDQPIHTAPAGKAHPRIFAQVDTMRGLSSASREEQLALVQDLQRRGYRFSQGPYGSSGASTLNGIAPPPAQAIHKNAPRMGGPQAKGQQAPQGHHGPSRTSTQKGVAPAPTPAMRKSAPRMDGPQARSYQGQRAPSNHPGQNGLQSYSPAQIYQLQEAARLQARQTAQHHHPQLAHQHAQDQQRNQATQSSPAFSPSFPATSGAEHGRGGFPFQGSSGVQHSPAQQQQSPYGAVSNQTMQHRQRIGYFGSQVDMDPDMRRLFQETGRHPQFSNITAPHFPRPAYLDGNSEDRQHRTPYKSPQTPHMVPSQQQYRGQQLPPQSGAKQHSYSRNQSANSHLQQPQAYPYLPSQAQDELARERAMRLTQLRMGEPQGASLSQKSTRPPSMAPRAQDQPARERAMRQHQARMSESVAASPFQHSAGSPAMTSQAQDELARERAMRLNQARMGEPMGASLSQQPGHSLSLTPDAMRQHQARMSEPLGAGVFQQPTRSPSMIPGNGSNGSNGGVTVNSVQDGTNWTYDDLLFMAPDPSMMMAIELDELDQAMGLSAPMERIDSGTGYEDWNFGVDEKRRT
ncbi:hypothetical protein BU26DRAFT_607661 [Trematosphaeria pertusa]|uniref:Uncharacterized protein n=1 Tax=Trematosphaeria pertusa TaxID=390896 RepID=A0A6A6I5T6_9PLEO|nr:uncharacterized protein BU26DRAFT_607661 [Trematosphaeria pertusa]KAF2245408.1 hypothetical protein BU26DRAFT_607661 [Trematosphaeria pertusa]